jgi:regulator of sigma D
MPNATPAGRPGFPAALLNDLRHLRLQLRKRLVLLLTCSTDDCASRRDTAALGTELLAYLALGHAQVFSGALRRRRLPDPVLQALFLHLLHSIDTTTDTLLTLLAEPDCQRISMRQGTQHTTAKLCRTLQLRFVLEEQVVEVLAASSDASIRYPRTAALQSPRRQRWKRASQG